MQTFQSEDSHGHVRTASQKSVWRTVEEPDRWWWTQEPLSPPSARQPCMYKCMYADSKSPPSRLLPRHVWQSSSWVSSRCSLFGSTEGTYTFWSQKHMNNLQVICRKKEIQQEMTKHSRLTVALLACLEVRCSSTRLFVMQINNNNDNNNNNNLWIIIKLLKTFEIFKPYESCSHTCFHLSTVWETSR